MLQDSWMLINCLIRMTTRGSKVMDAFNHFVPNFIAKSRLLNVKVVILKTLNLFAVKFKYLYNINIYFLYNIIYLKFLRNRLCNRISKWIKTIRKSRKELLKEEERTRHPCRTTWSPNAGKEAKAIAWIALTIPVLQTLTHLFKRILIHVKRRPDESLRPAIANC